MSDQPSTTPTGGDTTPDANSEVADQKQGLRDATDHLLETLGQTDANGTFSELRQAAEAHRDEPSSTDHQEHLGSRLQEALERFEVEHPGLTKAINDVSYYLSGLGL